MNGWNFMFKRRISVFFNQGTLLNRLLRNYAIIMVFLIIFGVASIGIDNYFSQLNKGRAVVQEAVDNLAQSINEKNLQGKNMLIGLTDSQEKLNGINQYMEQPIDQYLNYSYDQQLKSGNFLFLPGQIESFYLTYDNIESVMLVLNNYDEYYLSTKVDKGGRKIVGSPKLNDKFYLAYSINNPFTLENLGSFYVEFSKEDINSGLQPLFNFEGVSAYICSATNYQIYTYNGEGELTKEDIYQNRLIRSSLNEYSSFPLNQLSKGSLIENIETTTGFDILVTLTKSSIQRKTLYDLRILIIGGSFLIVLLLYILFRTFTKYAKQVDMIMETMSGVSKGDLDDRIQIEQTQYELKDLSIGINTMLNSIQQYVSDIYKLEIMQQEAHMRSLQSQINPHFLYNTLEYIRMYALSEGSEELADVVYAFSALLRNNTNQAKTTSLENELNFCEKYVYLYQMRYPDRVAYYFEIDDELKQLQIPKFTIQPLIENYFVHGIDFSRADNAISVKAKTSNDSVTILIRDNGKGMSRQKFTLVQQKLGNKEVEMNESIGLQNVNERLRAYFGATFQMKILRNEKKGITITISFKKGEAHEL